MKNKVFLKVLPIALIKIGTFDEKNDYGRAEKSAENICCDCKNAVISFCALYCLQKEFIVDPFFSCKIFSREY